MPKEIRNLRIRAVALVDKGANQEADIELLKREIAKDIGYNPMTAEQRHIGSMDRLDTNAEGLTIAEELWHSVMTRLHEIIQNDYSGRKREQIFAESLTSDPDLKAKYAAWLRARKSPTEAGVEKMAREAVAKRTGLTYEQAYARLLEDTPGLYRQIREEQEASASKVPMNKRGGETLRDAAWDKIELIGKAIKAQEPKLSIYQANDRAMQTELGRQLLALHRSDFGAFPVDYALEKIAKRTGESVADLRKILS